MTHVEVDPEQPAWGAPGEVRPVVPIAPDTAIEQLAGIIEPLHAEVAEAKRERDAYRAGAEKLNFRLKSIADQLQRTRQEREEAREAARIISAGKCSDPREWVERWPWLEETTDG